MFEGSADAAMRFYMSLFPGSKIKSLKLYDDSGPGAAGTVFHAVFSLGEQEFICIDSPVKHGFGFTPAISLHIACKSEEELTGLFAQLSTGGKVLMPLGPYPFAKLYAWVDDQFGVSWQLTLPN
jgi:predicted 3-demethylubiquinone-9 3-methyltransferase (glyoxalase superfamily)